MEDNSYLAELLGYLKSNFSKTNGNQSYNIYGAPKSRVIVDTKTPNMGYQPVRNSDIYINPKKTGDQTSSLETLFHEAAHTEQPRVAQLLEFNNPSYRALRGIDFPYYDWKSNDPAAAEKLATMRATEALLPAGKTIYDDSIGKDVLEQLQKKYPGKTEQDLRLLVDRGMFPNLNFAYPSSESKPTGILTYLQSLFK